MPEDTSSNIVAVVVTFNRRDLLARCLVALERQTRPPDHILVVDNASTDGTGAWLLERVGSATVAMTAVTLPFNGGGAGGFSDGMRLGLELGADWLWMMDDDAEPHDDALAELLAVSPCREHLYGSLAVAGDRSAWTTTLLTPEPVEVREARLVPALAETLSLPFLGFLIHRELAGRLGLPDRDYFIAADDIEYCLRARRAGARIYIAGRSRIEHPASVVRKLHVLGVSVAFLSIPPWKRYYDTRNRLLNARQYDPVGLITRALPGTFVRLVAALWSEPRKWAQLRAVVAGMIDGLLGRKGIRHSTWRITP